MQYTLRRIIAILYGFRRGCPTDRLHDQGYDILRYNVREVQGSII